MQKTYKYLSLALSAILHPVFVPTYAICMLVWAQIHIMLNPNYLSAATLLIGVTFVTTCILPIVMLLIQVKNSDSKDLALPRKEDRQMVYLATIVGMIIWCWNMYRMGITGYLLSMLVSATILMCAIMLINHWWKISIHLAALGALIGSVAAYQWHNGIVNLWFIPTLLILSLLLMCARIYLNSHTPMQVICGLLLGLIIQLLPVVILF